MGKINKYQAKAFAIFLILCAKVSAEPVLTNQTTRENSPLFKDVNGPISVTYGGPERLGKKLAIRELYLIPVDQISRRFCEVARQSCKDTFEAVFVYMKIQSIWPEPFLITASNVEVIAPKHNISLGPGRLGKGIVAEKITQNDFPSELLFQPGEIKTVGLSRGFKLNGVLDFFTGDVLRDHVMDIKTPFGIDYIGRVDDLNKFFEKTYGYNAAIRITLFEKDYQPLLSTKAYLNKGVDFFADGDVRRSSYNFQHDGFIGEVLYQLNGGEKSFSYRLHLSSAVAKEPSN